MYLLNKSFFKYTHQSINFQFKSKTKNNQPNKKKKPPQNQKDK